MVGSFNDTQLLEDLTAAADVVFDTVRSLHSLSLQSLHLVILTYCIQVDADMLEAAKIMLRGSKRRFQETGKPVIFIHTVRVCHRPLQHTY